MTAPNMSDTGEEADVTLAGAFGDLAEALAGDEDTGSTAPEPSAAPQDGSQAAAGTSAPQGQPQGGQPPQAANPQQPAQAAQSAAPTAGQPAAPAMPAPQPLNYTVDGQSRSFEGGYIVPGHGAIITADALPKLQDRLQQADRLVGQNQQLYQVTQEYHKLGGRAAFEQMQIDKAMMDASGYLLLRALTDQNTLEVLAADPVARQQLAKEIQLTAREAVYRTGAAIRESAAREAQVGQTEQRTQTAIHNAVGYLAQEFSGLTADDVAAVRQHAAKMHVAIVRPATPAEAREANVQVGAPVIDLPMLRTLLEDRHGLRNAALVQAQQRQIVARDNAARAAAAAPTTVTAPRPMPRSGNGQAPASPAQPKTLATMSSAEITRAMQSGRIYDMIGNEDEQ